MHRITRFARITNPRLIEGRIIHNNNVVFTDCWMHRPFAKNPLIASNTVVVKCCDLGFMYYALTSELMPDIKVLVLDVPYFETFVRGRFSKEVQIITRGVYPYSQIDGISYLSDAEIREIIDGMEEELVSTLD